MPWIKHRVCFETYRCENAELQRSTVNCLYSQRAGTSQSFSMTAGLTPEWQDLYLLHDGGSAKVWNIYEVVWDGTPFQNLPLWFWISAFSSALNNSYRESICLVRFFFFTWCRKRIESSQNSCLSSNLSSHEEKNKNLNLLKWEIDLERGKLLLKIISVFQNVLLEFRNNSLIPLQPTLFELQWEEKGPGEVENE